MNAKLLAFGEFTPRGDGTFIFRPREFKPWVSVTIAAHAASVSRTTMKRWVKSGYVVARRKGPKLWEVEVSSLPGMREAA